MPSFQDSIFLFILALLLVGPKKLPVLAHQLGKLMADFRRASNEFRFQMEEELRVAEQAEKQKKIAALQAAAPVAPALPEPDPPSPAPDGEDHPHLRTAVQDPAGAAIDAAGNSIAAGTNTAAAAPEPLPIATAGDVSLMPPATGLPTPHSSSSASPLAPFLNSVPRSDSNLPAAASTTPAASEETLHG